MTSDNRRSWPLVPNEALLMESEQHRKDSLLHPGPKHHHNGHHHHHHHNGHHHYKHGRHHHHDIHHHHENHHRDGHHHKDVHHRRDEQLNDNQVQHNGNNHSEETQSTEGNILNDTQHSHAVNHRHHRKHGNSLETVDIDSFLTNSNTETRERSKTHPTPETTYLDLFNKTELMANHSEEAKTINSISGLLASDAIVSAKRTNGIPEHNKNGALDEYSLSELLTSDDSSRRRSNETRCNSARSYSSPLSSQNGYYSKGTREFLQSKGIKMRDKRLSKVKNPQRGSKEATDSMIATIEKYHKICQLNYEHVEAQINSTFSRLSNSLNFRRKALVEEAKSIRNRKMEALDKLKEKCMQAPPTTSNVGSSNGQHDENQNDADPKEEEESLYKGINEPWGHSDTSNCNDQTNSDSLEQVKPPPSKGNTVPPLQNYGTDGTLSSSRLTLTGELEEGNMTFNFNNEESNIFKEIGCIKENLSSPQFSFTKGLSDVIGIVGDKIDFEVHSRDRFGDVNANSLDKLLVRIYDSNKKKIPVEDPSSIPKRKSSFSSHVNENKVEPGVYPFSFTPVKAGSHEISVKLNDAELSTSPFKFLVYSKSDLTFTNTLPSRNGEEQSEVNSPPTSISEDESTDDSDDDVFLNIRRDKNWLVHKEGKSSLLRSMSNVASGIYASQEVNGMCAWQIRVTTACMNIVLSVGVKTCSGIPDLDEQFTCEFRLLSFVETAHTLDKINHSKCSPRRKSSIFSRLSWTFTVLMNDGIIRVTCHELNEDKRIEINLVNSFSLHPFCSMIHHHNTAPLHVCPRPQLSFL